MDTDDISRDDNKADIVLQSDEDIDCGTTYAETEHYSQQLKQHDDEGEARSELPSYQIGNELNVVETLESLRDLVASDVIVSGDQPYTMFISPFEQKPSKQHAISRKHSIPLIYCDQTASNRPIRSIETYMEKICLPFYGNTHTNTSITGSQSTAFVAEARQIVAEETNAKITGKASLDIVLFTGSGATSAVELFIDCINLKDICRNAITTEQRPVIFIGPYEHHSNLIPWRETGCEIVMIPECSITHTVDIDMLERLLQDPKYSHRTMKIGSFTAASNVTGKLCDVNRIASILHKYNALSLFDYATASSYCKIDMNPSPNEEYPSASLIAKDAIFISPHKMIGGIGTPGILIVKKHLVSQINAPNRSGGGTVFYVTNTHHRFLSNRIHRYEGGTPNVAGIIRTGLTFLYKRQVDREYIKLYNQLRDKEKVEIPMSVEEYDKSLHKTVRKHLKDHAPNLVLLGDDVDDDSQNLPIFSFLVRFGKRFLHYNYVCAILNDVFGIQSRGGCQCAGPYSQRLLGLVTSTTTENGNMDVPNERNVEIEDALYRYKESAELLRPGYSRVSLPYKGLRSIEMDYVKNALVWVSNHGWALMCQYRCNHRTGEWRHASRQGKPLGRNERKWLSNYSLVGKVNTPINENSNIGISKCNAILQETLEHANLILENAKQDQRSIIEASKMADTDVMGKLDELRWYVYPKECADLLMKKMEQPSIEGGTILGAIHPTSITSCRIKNDNFHDRKRKHIVGNVAFVSNAQNRVLNTGLLTFGDGEHMGEATMNEIANGIDDGELSDQCEIFHPKIGESIKFEEFDQTTWLPTPQGSSSHSNIAALNHTGEPEKRVGISVISEQKKGSRTCTNWGSRSDDPRNRINIVDETHSINSKTTSADPQLAPSSTSKKQKFRHVKPPPKLMRTATQAIVQWDMIRDGDRLLLGLSGGKDSLSLLHLLLEFKRVRPIKFDLEVCTIDPMTPSFDPSPLIPYVESFGLKYHYIRDDIVSRASSAGKSGKMVSSLCAFCARMKRGNLYTCARQNNCNKLVLAQHLDDCAESMMMSMMHNGFLRTMKANYAIDAGDLHVIRPLIYCREGLMTAFAKDANLPVINENCPACFEEPKERARIKKMLSREETLYPNFYDNIRRSLIPLMHDEMAAILRAFTEEAVARSRKIPYKEKNGSNERLSHSTSNTSADVKRPLLLADIPDDDLILELARRKAVKFNLTLSKGEVHSNNHLDSAGHDPTVQVCTLNGGNGSIPCYELME
jgi:selenocysteine lyase/cysteine desulfurase/tRNA(Ile)-lysidine synthase TilS/MesJ